MSDMVEDYLKDSPKVNDNTQNKDEDCEEKRESLAILASLGETKTYLGKEMTLGDVHKLPPKEVEKYHKRYHAVSSKEVSSTLIVGSIKMMTTLLSRFVRFDNVDELSKDLEEDQLIK